MTATATATPIAIGGTVTADGHHRYAVTGFDHIDGVGDIALLRTGCGQQTAAPLTSLRTCDGEPGTDAREISSIELRNGPEQIWLTLSTDAYGRYEAEGIKITHFRGDGRLDGIRTRRFAAEQDARDHLNRWYRKLTGQGFKRTAR